MMTTVTSSRASAGGQALVWQGLRVLTILTDLVPPRIRFGHWNRLLGTLAGGRTLPVVTAGVESKASSTDWESFASAEGGRRLSCMLIAGALDTGGIETVVASLARGLGSFGFDVELVCSSGGRMEQLLRAQGVVVTFVSDAELAAYVARRRPDVVELHRMDPALFAAVSATSSPVVPVFHAMESYLGRAAWQGLRGLLSRAPASIAVSGSVRRHFEERTGTTAQVVENGVPPVVETNEHQRARARARARARVQGALGLQFGDDHIVLGLQRFSDQKNPAGLVDAFLLAAEQDDRLRLIIAGAANNWLEVRRAEVICRRHPCGDRVHFLGDSDTAELMAAADMFALDSFAEGGPIAALEAAAHGLRLVVTDVGFARELLDTCGEDGILVPRANEDFTQRAMARQRRRTHQSNRVAFATALLRMAASSDEKPRRGVPDRFTEWTMVAGHARVLRQAGHPRVHDRDVRRML